MSGVVGVTANDIARFTFFAASLTNLQAPVNTQIQWAVGSDRIRGRNNVVAAALDTGAEWVWFVDDDHSFPAGILARLLAHELPVVAALYLQRQVPFAPVAFSDRDDDGTYTPLFLPELPADELVAVRAAGTGGMLIRSEVFRAVSEPWFEHGEASEDLIFCEKARDAGFEVYCDLGARMGHWTSTAVWPEFDDETQEWRVGFNVAASLMMQLPIGTREQLAEFDAAAKATS